MQRSDGNGQTILSEALDKVSKLDVPPALRVSDRAAAVLVPLYEDASGIRVVLTLRSSKLRSHAGEVCLPGGKADQTDADSAATALREAHEEIGLSPDLVQVVNSPLASRPVLSKDHLSVTPVIGVISGHTRKQLRSKPAEVESVFDAPMRMFLRQSNAHSHQDATWAPGIDYRVHFFQHMQNGSEYTIWGLTAGILIEVAKMIYGQQPEFDDAIPGGAPYSDILYNGTSVVMRTQHVAGPHDILAQKTQLL